MFGGTYGGHVPSGGGGMGFLSTIAPSLIGGILK